MADIPLGWLAPHVQQECTDLSPFNGWYAQVVCYYANPQRTLVLYLSDSDASSRMLVLYNCRTINVKDSWTVHEFAFKFGPYGQNISDPQNGIHLEFDGGRVMTREEGVCWVAKLDTKT